MKTKITLALVVAACGASLVWFLAQPDGEGEREAIVPLETVPGAVHEPGAKFAADGRAGDEEPPAATPKRTVAAGTRAEPAGPWSGELAGVTGRLVEVDGTPVADLRVALLEVDGLQLIAGDWERLGEDPPPLRLDATRTDGRGRFQLGGARDGAFHALGIDLGGARSTLRVIDQALRHRARTDLGDIVLDAYGLLSGRVVDPEGRPVGGARVRVAPLPEEVLEIGIYDWRPESVLSLGGRDVLQLPARYRHWADLLPVPTAYTRSDGTFLLAGVPLTRVVGGIDKAGWAGTPIPETDAVGGEQNLGDLVLSRGRTVRGVVLDTADAPVPGAEVFAGALRPAVGVGLLQPCGVTDAAGRFSLTGAPADGALVAAARRAPFEAWISAVQEDGGEELRLRLPAVAPLTVHVRDADGAPRAGARLDVRPAPETEGGNAAEFLRLARAGSLPAPPVREVEPGTLVCAALTPGTYEVRALVEGLAPATAILAHPETGSEITLTCEAGRSIEVQVIDEATGEPVPRARASVLRSAFPLLAAAAVAWTDETGTASLGPYPTSPPAPDDSRAAAMFSTSPLLLVEHPRYADETIPLEGEPTAVTVALRAGGELHGRIHWGGAVPTRAYMVILGYRDAKGLEEILHASRFARSDLEGNFDFSNLPAGTYRAEVYELFFDEDPLVLLRDEKEPTRVFSEEVAVDAGATTELVVDLSPSGRGPTGRITGTVHVNGRAVQGADVRVRGNQDVRVTTDEYGAFDTGDVSVLRGLWISIEGDLELPGGPRRTQLFGENVRLAPDEVHRITVDLQSLEIPVLVVAEETGAPLEGAQVTASPRGESNSWRRRRDGVATGANGEARVLVLGEGTHDLRVTHPDFIPFQRSLEATSEQSFTLLRCEMSRAVPCAGRIIAHREGATATAWQYLRVYSRDGSSTEGASIDPDTLEFEVQGLGPGSYRAQIWIDGRRGEEVEFELGPFGSRNLELPFTPPADR